ncbi:hypothetical protein [Neptuniibacter sp. QD37_11]|uniref:hypothetical protein n=1 Tax=Neptuniibacter sp. QD37_11 TaxID=3398209 RepID=UPI0039F5A7BA
MYKFSKDYDHLYQLICMGHTATGFVDYYFPDDDGPYRDVVQIKRTEAWSINIGVRGMAYGDIMPFNQKDDLTELDAFKQNCKKCNLEWLPPTEPSAAVSPSKDYTAAEKLEFERKNGIVKRLDDSDLGCGPAVEHLYTRDDKGKEIYLRTV